MQPGATATYAGHSLDAYIRDVYRAPEYVYNFVGRYLSDPNATGPQSFPDNRTRLQRLLDEVPEE